MTDQYKKSQSKDKNEAKKRQQKEVDSVLWQAVTQDVTPLKDKNVIYRNRREKRSSKREPSVDTEDMSVSDVDKSAFGKTEDKAFPLPEPQGVVLKTNLTTDITIERISRKIPDKLADMDHRTRQRLKRGKMTIDGRIDLHGMTQQQAFQILKEYIPQAHNDGKRCILIITGKGQPRSGDPSLIERSESMGVLKQKTPEWLSTPPLVSYVLDIQLARPNHGGEGALYVLLRRKR